MTLALHIVTGILAMIGAYSVAQEVPRVRQRRRARSHDALMARIARLEIQTGVGLDVARDWIERQRKITKDDHLCMTGKWRCYGCGKWYSANGYGFHKLCQSCASSGKAAQPSQTRPMRPL